MARRPRRSIALVIASLVFAACSSGSGTGTEGTTSTTTSGATTSTSSVETTTTAPTTTTIPSTTSTTTTDTTAPTTSTTSTTAPVDDLADIDAEVGLPVGDGPFPTVVLVHGGGWVAGDPSVLRPLANYLEDNGFLTVNTRYALADLETPSFPEAADDVACAVRFAASHPLSDGTVTVIGHSAGAHIGAVVALTGEDYAAECPIDGSGIPDRFVGLAGLYDISRIGLAMAIVFGGGPNALPDVWEAGNPQLLTDRNTSLQSLIMYGELDGLVDDSFAFEFYDALSESGSESLLELVEGARHNDMHDPTLVGDLIVTWMER